MSRILSERNKHDGAVPTNEAAESARALQARRDSAITIRETLWRTRQNEIIAEKRCAWEKRKMESEIQLQEAKEEKCRIVSADRIVKKHQEVEDAYKDRCRNLAIKSKERKRHTIQTRLILEKIAKAQELEMDQKTARKQIKDEILAHKQHEPTQRRLDKEAQDALNKKREENIAQREKLRNEAIVENNRSEVSNKKKREQIIKTYNPARSVWREYKGASTSPPLSQPNNNNIVLVPEEEIIREQLHREFTIAQQESERRQDENRNISEEYIVLGSIPHNHEYRNNHMNQNIRGIVPGG